MANRVCIALIIALTLSLCVVVLATRYDTTENLSSNIVSKAKCQIIDEYLKEYDGYICYLRKTDAHTVDVYIRPDENRVLQAFDIYIDTEGCPYTVISHTGYSITQYETHIMSIANLLEMEMIKHSNYKIATLRFETDQSCCAKVTKAELVISHAVLPYAIDELYSEFNSR